MSGSQQVELPAGKDEYRRTEQAAILGINRASVARALRRLGLKGKGQGKVAQALARHSTITLTMDHYTHLDVLDVSGALDKLPPISGKPDAGKKPGEGRKHA
jgi:hypothetical protein